MFEVDDSGTPGAARSALVAERRYGRMFFKNRANDFPLDADSLAMYNPQRMDTALKTGIDIVAHDIPDFTGAELMQIKCPVDRVLDRILFIR